VGRVAVVFGGFTLEVEGDVALLLAVSGGGFDGIDLLTVAEGHLDAEGAIGGEGHFFAADGEAGRRIGGAVDDQLSISALQQDREWGSSR
jgi:hypothetical protein